jgi:DNA polymerase III delta prime subunit
MQIKELEKVSVLHHAYIVVGSAKLGVGEVLELLRKRDVVTKGNPDVLVLSYSELLVEYAGEISGYASLKPLGHTKYLVVSFSRATREAQNALLKIVEEAPGGTVFFFCVDAVGHLLPTLRSRAIILEAGAKEERETDEAEAFLKESYPKRLAAVEKMTGYIAKTQDRLPVRLFIKELAHMAHAQKLSAPYLRDLLDADRYLRMQGSSAKAILGHLAVSLPRIS